MKTIAKKSYSATNFIENLTELDKPSKGINEMWKWESEA